MIPKSRLDALTDGVFSVAMTLLVIDLRLPETFQPQSAADLLHRIVELGSQLLVYVISFYVLALRWTGMVKLAPRGEEVSEAYTKWAMLHLLLITLVPFTTMLIGRYPTLAPAVWFYAANTVAFALVAARMVTLSEHRTSETHKIEDRIGLSMLIASAVVAVLISLVEPKWALLGFVLNSLDAPLRRLVNRRGNPGRG
ncbi:TMEM175 family protein [Nitrobacter sp.]|uniref:TMEM175 family protein n=1 Tax=Nitrobacter sp. TaxID=29420 RepID=UPI003F64D10A